MAISSSFRRTRGDSSAECRREIHRDLKNLRFDRWKLQDQTRICPVQISARGFRKHGSAALCRERPVPDGFRCFFPSFTHVCLNRISCALILRKRMLWVVDHGNTHLSSFSCSTMHGAHIRRACTVLIPLRTFWQHVRCLQQPATCLEEGRRWFGRARNTSSLQGWRSITTAFAAQTSPAEATSASGDYGADQIQVHAQRRVVQACKELVLRVYVSTVSCSPQNL